MIRTFSLQARPQERDRSFYAYGDHRPPSIFAPEQPEEQVNKQSSSIRQQMHDAHCQQELQLLMIEQAAGVSSSANRGAGSNSYAPVPVDFQQATVLAQADGSRKRSIRSGASPMLSDLRTRSHFGVSTQMIIEDGPCGDIDSGNPILIKRDTGLQQAINKSSLVNDYNTTGGPMVNRRGPANFIKAFNRQLTTNEKANTRISVGEEHVKAGPGGKHFRKRNHRGSMVSDTYDHVVAQKVAREGLCQPLDHLASSAEHLSKFQNELAHEGQIDHLKELRRMEQNMETVRMNHLNSTVLTSVDDRMHVQQTTSGGENIPASPTLNVVLPANIQTGFTDSNQQSYNAQCIKEQNGRPGRVQSKKRRNTRTVKRAKSANQHRVVKRGVPREVTADECLDKSVVVMNEKKMAVAHCATAKGIISLYNKGFVPKKTGKVSKRSNFAGGKQPLYQVDDQDRNATEYQTRGDIGTIRSQTEIEDVEYSFEGQHQALKPDELGHHLQEIESGYASFSNIKLELRQGGYKEKLLHDSIAAQQASGCAIQARSSVGTAGLVNQSNIFQIGKTQVFGNVNTISEGTGNITDPNTNQDKKSRGTSDIVMTSVNGGQIGEGIIDYGAREIPINDQQDFADGQEDSSQDHCQQRSGHFLIMPVDGGGTPIDIDLTPKVRTSSGIPPLDFGKDTNLTNADHESRETEGDENVMRPIMQERAGSADHQHTRLPASTGDIEQKKVEQVVTTKAKLVKDNNYANQLLPPKVEKPRRLQSGRQRKSVQSKQSLNPTGSRGLIRIDPSHHSKEKMSETVPPLTNFNLTSNPSSKGALNADLGSIQAQQKLNKQMSIKQLQLSAGDTSPKNQRNRFSYSQAQQESRRNMPKTRSSNHTTYHGFRSPNETSMTVLVGASLMTRPLIGNQAVKKIKAQNSSTNPLLRNLSKIAIMSTDCLQKQNQLIHLEVDNITKVVDVVEINEEDKKMTINQPLDSATSADHLGGMTMTLTPKELNSSNAGIRSGITARDLKIGSGQLNISTSGDIVRGQCAVLVNDQKLDQALTLEKLVSGPPPMMLTPSVELISRTDGRNKSQPVMSGYSSRTQQIDAKGKIRHVFLINKPSGGDLKKQSSGEKLASSNKNYRKSAYTMRRRRRRPSSSRLRKRGHHFKLNSDQSTCGEEIATVQGGSTSREHQQQQDQLSPDKVYANRRVSHHQVASLDITRPALQLLLKTDSKSNSNRSLAQNHDSSSSNVSNNSLKFTSNPEMNRARTSDHGVNEAILSGSVQVSRISLSQQKYFGIDANKINSLPHEATTLLQQPYEKLIHQDQLTKHHRVSACHSINDYLRHEEISRVKISELQTTEFMNYQGDLQTVVNDDNMNNITLQNQDSSPNPNSANVTLFRVNQNNKLGVYSVQSEEEKVDLTSGGQQTNLPRQAMYSQMSALKAAGSNTLETSNNMTDPNCRTGGPNTPVANGQLIFVASNNDRAKEGQMMVVTTIRSKNTYDNKTSVTTMPQEQQKFTLEGQDKNAEMPLRSNQEPNHHPSSSYVTEALARGAEHHFISSNTRGSVLSRDQILNMRYTPDRITAEEQQKQAEPLSQQTQAYGSSNTHTEGVFVRTPFSADSGTQSGVEGQIQTSDPFNLSASIKLNQQMLKMVQINCQDISMHNKLVKQDQAIQRRDRCVIPTTVATVPEKTQFQRRLFNEQRQPDLSVVGQQTYTVTMQQLKNHVAREQDFYQSFQAQQNNHLQQQMLNMQQQQHYVQSQVTQNEAKGTLNIQEQNTTEVRVSQEHIDPKTQHATRDQGLQPMMREEMTSFSGNSQNFFGRPNVNGNMISETYLQRQPSTQYHAAFDLEMPTMHETELLVQRASKEFFTAQEEAQASLAIANMNALVNRDMQTPSTDRDNELARSQDHLAILRNQQELGMMARPDFQPKSPLNIAVTDDGTDIDPSPYGPFKNNPRLQGSNQRSLNRVASGTRNDNFSPSKSQQHNLSAELQKQRMSGSNLVVNQPDLQGYAGEKLEKHPDVHLRGQFFTKHKTMVPTSFTMQEANDQGMNFAKNGEAFGDEPQVNTIGVGIDIETVRSSVREQNNQTILLNQVPSAVQTETRFSKENIIINQKASIQNNQPLLAAAPASFDIKVKVGSTVSIGTYRRSTQRRIGDHQGAPPNYFMRKGSNISDVSDNSNLILQRQDTQTLRSKRNTQVEEGVNNEITGVNTSGAISLAVETRNALTGMRKKIVKSAIQSPEPDRTSEQTQTDKCSENKRHSKGQRDQNTLTINAYDTSVKMPSETSQAILRPRGGVGYQQEGYPTSHNSISVTVGRVAINSSKDRLSPHSRLSPQEESLLQSYTKQQDAECKVQNSKSNIYASLASAMTAVGNKSLHHLGVWSEMTQQQTFNNIRHAELRRQEITEQKRLKKDKFSSLKQQEETEQLKETKGKKAYGKNHRNKSKMKEISDLTGGVLGGDCQITTKKGKTRRAGSKKSTYATQTHDPMRASQQQLLDYSTNKNFDSFNHNVIETSKSGIFDLQGHDFQPLMQNHRMAKRTAPDYSKKSTIQNMMAKRQKDAQSSNVPLPALNSVIPSVHSSIVTKTPHSANMEMQLTGFRQQGPITISAMTETGSPLGRAEEYHMVKPQLAQLEQQQPVMRPGCYSTTQSLKPMGHATSATNKSFKKQFAPNKPTRPISSGVYMRSRRNRENNITPSLGVLQEVTATGGQGRNLKVHSFPLQKGELGTMRPQTAQQRGAMQSTKRSSQMHWGGVIPQTQEGTNSDHTQASSMLFNQRIASGMSGIDQNTNFYAGQKADAGINYNTNSNGMQGSNGHTNLISRNLKQDYATADKSGAESITIMHATSPSSYTAMRQQKQQSTGPVGKRTRPFSGVHSINTRGSLIGLQGKPPAVMTAKSLTKNQMQRDFHRQQHQFGERQEQIRS